MDITRRSVGWQKFGKRCSLKVANYDNDMNDGRWKMEDSESVAASKLLPPSPNLETRQLQLLAAVTLLQGLPSTFLGRSSSRGGDVERR